MNEWAGQRVTVMGLGLHGGGLGAVRYLVEHGARVTVTDLADETILAEPLRALQSVAIDGWRFGRHEERDFRHIDAVVVNPAVKPGHPLIGLARQSGARITSEAELFLNACPAPIIGVTGSNGKSSTATMIAEILRAAGGRVWLGGNIGGSLLADLPNMSTADHVVLELSSFQLFWLSASTRMPTIAVVTNCTPNHLDWHGTWEHYVHSKQRIVVEQATKDVAILNDVDPEVRAWHAHARGRATFPSTNALSQLMVPGEHQRQNARLAATVAQVCGCDPAAIETGLGNFRGLPHRLELVTEVQGRRFFNDSKSTTPAATIAALSSFGSPVWLLAGGHNKGLDLDHLAVTIVSRVRGAAMFGAVREVLHGRVCDRSPGFPCAKVETLDEALAWCWSRAQVGENILLSPACASFDQYRDYRQRGERFVALVRGLGRG